MASVGGQNKIEHKCLFRKQVPTNWFHFKHVLSLQDPGELMEEVELYLSHLYSFQGCKMALGLWETSRAAAYVAVWLRSPLQQLIPKVCTGACLSLTFPFSFTAGDVGLGEGAKWKPAGEAHGQPPPRTDSQSGDCLGRILGIWGRSVIPALSQGLLSVWLNAEFGDKGILSSGLSFHSLFTQRILWIVKEE